MATFQPKAFLPEEALARVTETRITDPDFSLRAATARKRRATLAPRGRLNILAADHPARRVTQVGENPIAMTDRHDYLARITRVLMSDVVDGVMATMDILEDLLSLDAFIRAGGGRALCDDKVLIASLNRGGLAQSCWEMNDPITGAFPQTCVDWSLDGTKILLRIVDDDPASLGTMLTSAGAITEANALGLPTFLEPLPVVHGAKGYTVVKEKTALARIVGVASALGDSSRRLWLKLPYCEDYETVARATTLPILLLGGESAGDPTPILRDISSALAAGSNVRGALVGRNVLYPGDEDPLAIAEAAGGIIHKGWGVEQALAERAEHRGRDVDHLCRYLRN